MPISKIDRKAIDNSHVVDAIMTRVIPKLNEVIDAFNALEHLHSGALKALEAPRRFEIDLAKTEPFEAVDDLFAAAVKAEEPAPEEPEEPTPEEPEEPTPEEPAPAPDDQDFSEVFALFQGLSARMLGILNKAAIMNGWTADDVMAMTEEDFRMPGLGQTSAVRIYAHLHPQED